MGRRRGRTAESSEASRSAAEGQQGSETTFTESYTAADFARDQQEAQRNALADLGAEAAVASPDAPGVSADEQLGWCSMNGLSAALTGGALGGVFGVGEWYSTHVAPLCVGTPCRSPSNAQSALCVIAAQNSCNIHGLCALQSPNWRRTEAPVA